MYRTLNPATEELIRTYELSSENEIESALNQAFKAFYSWKELSFGTRSECFNNLSLLLKKDLENYAQLITSEMGKPIVQARAEIKKCAEACEFYAAKAEGMLEARQVLGASGKDALIFYEPFGPILAIMPWNFPFYQVFRFAAPNMMAGNTVILKHAPNTPACALAIESAFKEAGFPQSTFTNLFLTNAQAAKIIADSRIRGVTLTGSARAGREVGAIAGANLKKMVFELGGSDPFIVLEDADLNNLAELAARSRCANSGQVCCSAKRFIVPRKMLDDFTSRFAKELEKYVPADPSDEASLLGPLAREDLRVTLKDQVERAKSQGAKVLYAGSNSRNTGFYFPPMILSAGERGSPLYKEELFGPVATVLSYDSEEQAIAFANDSEYGLSAVVCSEDFEHAKAIAKKLECGTVSINSPATSDLALPFGGVKSSGFGRELGVEGIKEFVSTKVIL